jgi:threonine dehydrogenase-like Zn-dependent dehydrogenase
VHTAAGNGENPHAAMKIAVITEPRRLELADAPLPDIGPDDVLVRVANCGVCASEVDIWEGRGSTTFPWFPGHEVSGVVEVVGDGVASLTPGQPVAVWTTTRGFAEFVAVKAEHCLPAEGLPLELALAEPLACAVNAVELARVSLGNDVVLIGAGFMGNVVQKLVALRGPRHLIVADARPDALPRAERLGATRTVDVGAESLPNVVHSLTDGGADVTFEVTGVQAPLLVLGGVTRTSGKIVIVGYHQGGVREIPLGEWNWNAFEIVNAHFRDVATIMGGMRIGMRLLTSGRLEISDLVTHRYPLAEIGRAFEAAHDRPEGFVKATVTVAQ